LEPFFFAIITNILISEALIKGAGNEYFIFGDD
jgi:hypothetical protein